MSRFERALNAEYGSLQSFYWANYGVSVMFAVTFLLSRGLSNSAAGTVMAAGNILACLVQPLAASLSDRHKGVTPPRILYAFSAAMLLSLAVLLLIPGAPPAVLAAYVVYMAFQLAGQPVCSCFCAFFARRGAFINFGLARGLGSLVYAVLTAVLGLAVARLGANILPTAGIITAGGFFVSALLLGRRARGFAPGAEENAGAGRALTAFLRENRRFCVLLLGIMIIYFSHNVFNCYTLNLVEHLGGTSADMGALCAFVAVFEMPAMFFFEPLSRRFSTKTLMRISAVAFSVKAALIYLSGSLTALYLANVLQAVSFAVFVPASVRYVDETVPAADAMKGQSCITSVITLGSVLSSLLGGIMLDRLGVSLTFLICAAVSVLGTAAAVGAIGGKRA